MLLINLSFMRTDGLFCGPRNRPTAGERNDVVLAQVIVASHLTVSVKERTSPTLGVSPGKLLSEGENAIHRPIGE
jgi:hypothetical protein